MQRNTSYTNGLNEKLKKTYCQPALGLARQLAASSLPRRSLNIRWGSCRLKAFRPDMLRNRARDTSVHPRRAGRRQKGGGRGRASRASPRRGAPAMPHLGGVDRGQRLQCIQRLLRIQLPQRFQRILPLQRLQRHSSPRPSTPASGKSALSAPRGACNRPPCRRGAPRIVEGPQVPGGQVTRAASSARDAIGTNEKNQQTENGQTTEPQLVSAIRSKRVSE